jgi:hypothetical protein
MSEPEVEPKPAPLPKDDEWRGNDGTHRRFALGCSAVVALVILAFWIARAAIMR